MNCLLLCTWKMWMKMNEFLSNKRGFFSSFLAYEIYCFNILHMLEDFPSLLANNEWKIFHSHRQIFFLNRLFKILSRHHSHFKVQNSSGVNFPHLQWTLFTNEAQNQKKGRWNFFLSFFFSIQTIGKLCCFHFSVLWWKICILHYNSSCSFFCIGKMLHWQWFSVNGGLLASFDISS